MSGSATPLLVVPLRDGTQARLTAMSLAIGAKEYPIARISVARQVSPDPVTVALLIAGVGMVEFQPQRPEDGAIMLEGIFRLRPDLRPPGFEVPANMPPIAILPGTMLPSQGIGRVPGAYPGVSTLPDAAGLSGVPVPPLAGPYPSAGSAQPTPWQTPGSFGSARAPMGPYASAPMGQYSPDGRLSPVPRGAFMLYGASLIIYGLRFLRWLLLGVLVALVPSVLSTASGLVVFYALGIDPLQPFDMRTGSDGSVTFTQGGHAILLGADTQRLMVYGAIGVGAYLLSQLVAVYQFAVLSVATRDALLGRTPRVGASLGSGLRRFFPTLGASILVGLVMAATGALFAGCIAISEIGLTDASASASGVPSSPIVLLGMLGGILLVPVMFVGIFLWGRLLLAPFVAATEPVGPGRAFGRSWRLTRRHWWHTVVPVVLMQVTATSLVLVFSTEAFGSGLGAQVASVVVTALVAPLGVIVATCVLFDLRLRSEGFAAVVGDSKSAMDNSVAANSHPPIHS